MIERIVFETALGHVALARRGGVLVALSFGYPCQQAAGIALLACARLGGVDSCGVGFCCVEPGEDRLADRIGAYARGEPGMLDDVIIDMRVMTRFQRRVVVACRAIPHGKTCTYGELAEAAGRPAATRAVGTVMARNRFPLVVPCHRVVPAAGGLGRYSAFQGVAMKGRLLELEQRA
ncbi:MAG: methylated-DNA--[protein]-cysteine S-methyltransferase [Pirellulales bacterium]|nr:methylated-DNA--[protein]-cysteine S-methyltransferase [Pirellulales bacterium]